MGRLSDARKKAKATGKKRRKAASPVLEAEKVDSVSVAAPLADEPAAGKEPLDDRASEVTQVPGETEAVEAVISDADFPASFLNDEETAAQTVEEETPAAKPASGGLPASGLADDILAAMEAADPVPESEEKEAADPNALDWDAFFPDPAPGESKPQQVTSLPASGLADEILRLVNPETTRRTLELDDIREFEGFFEEDTDTAENLQLVLFRVDRETFSLEIEKVQEIIKVPAITRVPNAAGHVRGVFNMRGRVVPVFDLRRLLNLPAAQLDKHSRIMVLNLDGKWLGVLIDQVYEVARLEMPDVEPAPEEITAVDRNLVTGVAKHNERMVFLLDIERVLDAH